VRSDALHLSPHDAYPLGWFGSRYLPGVFGVLGVFGGAALMVIEWQVAFPGTQQFALGCLAVAFLLIWRMAAPHRTEFGWRQAGWPLLLSWVGVAVSAAGYSSGPPPIESWWAPISATCVLMALLTRSSALSLIGYTLGATGVCAASTLAGWARGLDFWPPVSVAVLAGVTPLMGGIAAATYAWYMASRTLRWQTRQTDAAPQEPSLSAPVEGSQRQDTIESVTRVVSPFLARIAEGGTVTPADRARAVELAADVRRALVSRLESSWLDDLAAAGGFTVADPARMAERLPSLHRSALRGLLTAVVVSPALGEALTVQLEPQKDGVRATVRMSLGLTPQRRRDLLAPYFLTLKSVSQSAQWQEGEQLSLRFQLPALQNG
jgi:hypothetical protein